MFWRTNVDQGFNRRDGMRWYKRRPIAATLDAIGSSFERVHLGGKLFLSVLNVVVSSKRDSARTSRRSSPSRLFPDDWELGKLASVTRTFNMPSRLLPSCTVFGWSRQKDLIFPQTI